MSNNTHNAFDFGFSIVDEQELEAVQAAHEQVESTSANADEAQARLTQLYDAVQPLLNNLRQSADKEYIWWPNRLEKIEQFQDMLDGIYKGK
jgi:hypothetical protein